MAIEHQGEATGTVLAEVRANGKVVAETRFTYGFGEEPGYIYRKSFLWDTKGVPPGEYRIRGDVFLWYDSSESDNYLDLRITSYNVCYTKLLRVPASVSSGRH